MCPKDDLMNIVNYNKNSLMITVFLRLALILVLNNTLTSQGSRFLGSNLEPGGFTLHAVQGEAGRFSYLEHKSFLLVSAVGLLDQRCRQAL